MICSEFSLSPEYRYNHSSQHNSQQKIYYIKWWYGENDEFLLFPYFIEKYSYKHFIDKSTFRTLLDIELGLIFIFFFSFYSYLGFWKITLHLQPFGKFPRGNENEVWCCVRGRFCIGFIISSLFDNLNENLNKKILKWW